MLCGVRMTIYCKIMKLLNNFYRINIYNLDRLLFSILCNKNSVKIFFVMHVPLLNYLFTLHKLISSVISAFVNFNTSFG